MSLNGCLVGVTSHITPLPAGEGLGEGPVSYGFETVRKRLSELCVLCERKIYPATLAYKTNVRENLPSNLFVYHLIARVLSIPHRKTRKNRTHRVKNK